MIMIYLFFFKQKTAYEMRISDWSSDVCSSDLAPIDALRDIMDRDARRGPQRDRAADRRAAEQIVPQAQRQADPHRPHFSAQKLPAQEKEQTERGDRKSTRLNSSH